MYPLDVDRAEDPGAFVTDFIGEASADGPLASGSVAAFHPHVR